MVVMITHTSPIETLLTHARAAVSVLLKPLAVTEGLLYGPVVTDIYFDALHVYNAWADAPVINICQ